MGADMHFYIEYKNKNNEWEYLYLADKEGNPIAYYYRNYLLFGLLAEVRAMGVDNFTKSNRQMPNDISKEITEEWNTWKDHSHSSTWYTLSELDMFLQHLNLQVEFEKYKLDNLKNVSEDELDWQRQSYLETKESAEILSTFINFIKIVLFHNDVFEEENVRIILWFDN